MKFIICVMCFLISSLSLTAQVVPVDSVSNYIGKNIVVFGEIVDGRYLINSTNKPTLLNMGGKFPNQKLTVVIYGADRGNFGYKPEEMLMNKVIYVTGKVEMYRDQPQMVVSGPFNISFSNPNGSTVVPTANIQPGKIETDKKDKQNKAEQPSKAIKNTSSDTPDKPLTQTSNSASLQEGAILILPGNVRLKSGPGRKFTNAGKLKKGTEVVIISITENWIKIKEKKPDEGAFAVTGYVTNGNLQ